MVTAKELIERLQLKPHREGGYFAEVWRSPEKLAVNALPPRYSGSRALSTSIYYLLTHDTFSKMHRLRSDEVFHFYLGEPVEMLVGGDIAAVVIRIRLVQLHDPQLAVGIERGARGVDGEARDL